MGTDSGGFWRSSDYGAPGSWIRRDLGPPGSINNFGGAIWSIAVDAADGTIYANNGYSSEMGVHRSTDGGANWKQVLPAGFPYDVYNISADPYLSKHVIVGFHSRFPFGDELSTGVAESFDGGDTWTYHAPIPNTGVGHFAMFLGDSSTWLLGTQSAGFWRTTDNGKTWKRVANIDMTHGGSQVVKFKDAWYAAAVDGLLRSTDEGASWKVVSIGGKSYFTGLMTDGERLFTRPAFPTSHGWDEGPMWVSTDGLRWNTYNDQSFINGPMQMAADERFIYGSMWDAGLWRLPIRYGETLNNSDSSR